MIANLEDTLLPYLPDEELGRPETMQFCVMCGSHVCPKSHNVTTVSVSVKRTPAQSGTGYNAPHNPLRDARMKQIVLIDFTNIHSRTWRTIVWRKAITFKNVVIFANMMQ